MSYYPCAPAANTTYYAYNAQPPAEYVVVQQQQPVAQAYGYAQQPQQPVAQAAAPSEPKKKGFMSKMTDKASKIVDHAMEVGVTGAASALGGKASYLASMMAAGGTTKYWKKLFAPPPEDVLRDTFGCHLMQGDNDLVPGVLFVSDFAVCFSSDVAQKPNRNTDHPGGYLKIIFPIDHTETMQPHSDAQSGDQWLGIIMLNKGQFWFKGFIEYDLAMKRLTEVTQRYAEIKAKSMAAAPSAPPAPTMVTMAGPVTCIPMPVHTAH